MLLKSAACMGSFVVKAWMLARFCIENLLRRISIRNGPRNLQIDVVLHF